MYANPGASRKEEKEIAGALKTSAVPVESEIERLPYLCSIIPVRSGSERIFRPFFPRIEYLRPVYLNDPSNLLSHLCMKQRNRFHFARKPLQSGQVWQIEDSNLRVEIVGKLLVHYKLGKADAKRTATSISGKKELEKYLTENRAILVQE